MRRRTLVVGDIHLHEGADPTAGRALATYLERDRDAALIFAGDAIDVAADLSPPVRAVGRALATAPELSRALAERASRGVPVTFVAGNHDTTAGSPAILRAVHDALGLSPEHRRHVTGAPWFVQLSTPKGVVHVEHGHVFDPDGAPTHPLAPEPRDDLGIRLLRRFIVPVDAQFLVHKNHETPLWLLLRVVRKYGPRAPWIVARYCVAAASIVAESGKRLPLHSDRAHGAARLDELAVELDLDRDTLAMLHEAHATPTMARATAAFARLYLDRVAATGAIVGGLTVAAVVPPLAPPALSVAALGALVLTASIVAGKNRYAGRAERALAEGAERVRDITGARTVVMGHVHREIETPGYFNTASFAYAQGERRPMVAVEENGDVRRIWG